MRKYGVYGESVIVPASAVAHYPKTLTERRHGNLDAVHYRIRSTGGVWKSQSRRLRSTAASSSVDTQQFKLRKQVQLRLRRLVETQKQMLLGADHVIVTNDEDLVSRVMEITNGHGVGLISILLPDRF